MKTSAHGFTLVEMVVVLALIVAVSGFAIPSFSTYVESQNISRAQTKLKNDIRYMQSRALSGDGYEEGLNYIVLHFAPDQTYYDSVRLSSATCPPLVAPEQRIYINPNSVSIHNASNLCLYFSYADGKVTANVANSSVYLGDIDATGNDCVSLTVNSNGQISEADGAECY